MTPKAEDGLQGTPLERCFRQNPNLIGGVGEVLKVFVTVCKNRFQYVLSYKYTHW